MLHYFNDALVINAVFNVALFDVDLFDVLLFTVTLINVALCKRNQSLYGQTIPLRGKFFHNVIRFSSSR